MKYPLHPAWGVLKTDQRLSLYNCVFVSFPPTFYITPDAWYIITTAGVPLFQTSLF